jgi:hypothetical protein
MATHVQADPGRIGDQQAPARPHDSPSLPAVEAAILAAGDIEEWHREMLLTEVRSLDAFYRARSQS